MTPRPGGSDAAETSTNDENTPATATANLCSAAAIAPFLADLDDAVLQIDIIADEVPPGFEPGTALIYDKWQKLDYLKTRVELLNAKGCSHLEELRTIAVEWISAQQDAYAPFLVGQEGETFDPAGVFQAVTDAADAKTRYTAKHRELEAMR